MDVGAALRAGKEVLVDIFSGKSALSPGSKTGKTESIGRLLSPLAQEEVGTIRCIGLNVCNSLELELLAGRRSGRLIGDKVRAACEGG